MTEIRHHEQGYELLTPEQANGVCQAQPSALLIDVRSQMEFLMIGHPVGAVNVPWIDEPNWEVNPQFAADVRKLLLGRVSGRDRGQVPVMLICRSGNRSVDAARALVEAQLPNVFVVSDGFEGPLDAAHQRSSVAGWRFNGLPWEQC